MDGTVAGEERKAPRLTAIGSASSAAPAVPVDELQTASLLPGPGNDASATAGGGAAVESGGSEEQDEQVERFYALLASIRALRGLYTAGGSASADHGGSGSGSSPGGRGSRKRAREAEPPWRPAFRMEDFKEGKVAAVDAGRAEKRQKAERRVGAGQPAGSTVTDDDHDEEKGEVVEEPRKPA